MDISFHGTFILTGEFLKLQEDNLKKGEDGRNIEGLGRVGRSLTNLV
jgi:hypothetical protein